MKPACADWDLWLGKEIEGIADIGVWTLFVRKNQPAAPLVDLPEIRSLAVRRVWFCKEYTRYEEIIWALKSGYFDKVCVEATLLSLSLLPEFVRSHAQIYLKVPVALKVGDHICVGEAFHDEAFYIGHGVKVVSSDYDNDIKL